MKNQGNMTPRETHKSPITDPKEMEICELSDKEFRVILFIKIFYFTNFILKMSYSHLFDLNV